VIWYKLLKYTSEYLIEIMIIRGEGEVDLLLTILGSGPRDILMYLYLSNRSSLACNATKQFEQHG